MILTVDQFPQEVCLRNQETWTVHGTSPSHYQCQANWKQMLISYNLKEDQDPQRNSQMH